MTELFQLLRQYLWPQRLRLAGMVAFMLGGIVLQLRGPQFLREVIDGARAQLPEDEIIRLSIWFFVVMLASELVRRGTGLLTADVGWRATNRLRADLSLHCLAQDSEFHARHPPGELIQRVDGDVGRLATFLSQFTLNVVISLLTLFGVLGVLFHEGWKIGSVSTVIAVIVLAILLCLRNLSRPLWTESRERIADMFAFLEERLAGREDLCANGAAAHTLGRFRDHLKGCYRIGLRAMLWSGGASNGMWLVFGAAQVITLAFAIYLFRHGELTLGAVYLTQHYMGMVLGPLGRMVRQVDDFQRIRASVDRVESLLASTSDVVSHGESGLSGGPVSVGLSQVSFAYFQGPRVLHDVSFELVAGRRLGLLGRTGSGKTTITRLLLRLFDPQSGVVQLGGVDVRQVDAKHLRRRVAVVTQDVQLFAGSVRDNIALFDDDVDDELILHAVEQLGLRTWFDGLPAGLDSVLPRGGGLSAGEAQLLAFTRVLLRDPGLVLLDEASSRLDPATEGLLQIALERLLEGRTGVIIAHRLATLDRVDDILLLEEGRIVEQGPREQLQGDPRSRFSGLRQAGLESYL
jgi:ATP-binding cassette, subfamily B, bacterial